MNRTQLKKFNKLWKNMPSGLNDLGREEYIRKVAPLFRLTKDDLAAIVNNIEYDQKKNKFVKKGTTEE